MNNTQINCAITNIVGADRDYAGCLNAMHEAEKVLSDKQFLQYAHYLSNAAASFRVEIEAVAMSLPILRHNLVSATAAQRAEAFLRTVGLWKDDK